MILSSSIIIEDKSEGFVPAPNCGLPEVVGLTGLTGVTVVVGLTGVIALVAVVGVVGAELGFVFDGFAFLVANGAWSLFFLIIF